MVAAIWLIWVLIILGGLGLLAGVLFAVGRGWFAGRNARRMGREGRDGTVDSMFCPYCAAPIDVLPNGTGKCRNGFFFSRQMTARLLKLVGSNDVDRQVRKHLPSDPFAVRYCPRCTADLEPAVGRELRCTACGLPVEVSLIYELIRLNPHSRA